MNSFMLSLLMGMPDGSGGAASGSFISTLIPFALIILIFYFLIIRPQNKKQKETQRMLDALKKGDKIVTIGGIHGVVQSVKDGSVIVKVDESTKMEFSRSAISSVNAPSAPKAEKEDKKADKSEKIEDKDGDSTEDSDDSK
ncbi:preprotein translocase subunit YajC [Breznakiella homolactica]|uniref:Sec translocon accessory complex subunit YajC n=1 Tax=Breznakiella homolactica TaxID=2798577 RepID=A0A7T8BCA1_9SPIR|nr:preprotein translocase subunit YajC [Breznakiella homolactica]QQO11211.1 preprotein translocase subunit YajC [Breznakiella homolactica]